MDYRTAFAISAAGMQVEQTRFNISALNLANANSTMGADGRVYRAQRVITSAGSGNIGGFNQVYTAWKNANAGLAGPHVEDVVEQNLAPRRVLDPGHPAADEKGFVELPGVNPATEMVTLMNSLRAYEANVVAMNAAKSMTLKALEIGGK
ncbi:flagellar basal body rod protein FlgC [Polaromonas sp. A23]|uniref:flagellar basal body rod protein FlgC n=1 Tax=Polaromonas sp. A23 TaxID=1944133 RepID=UPI0009870D8A|nr:flagellar basal body rod protein FlgC [Polaromonas sp. A23]OOG44444.1 flagellar basal body rod protein FlgC [Polaromonas sp. A23]